MNNPKRHHYVPRKYLEGFTKDLKNISIFDRRALAYRTQSIVNTAVQNHYYRISVVGGGKSTEVETFFANIESETWPIIDKLNNRLTLTATERHTLALYVSFQMTRTPDYEKRINESEEKMIKHINKRRYSTVEETRRIMNENNDSPRDTLGVSPEELFEFIQGGEYGVEFSREHAIESTLKIGSDIAEYFVQMNWLVLHAPYNSSFITTDAPYSLIPPDGYDPNSFWGVGITTLGAKKILPLTATCCLLMLDKGNELFHKNATRDFVRHINFASACSSDEYIFARDMSHLESIVKKSGVLKLPVDRERVHVS